MTTCPGCAIHPVTPEWVLANPALAAADINSLREQVAALLKDRDFQHWWGETMCHVSSELAGKMLRGERR